MAKFKRDIYVYSALVMVICEIVSLPFLGFNLRFLYGLFFGTVTSIANFSLLSWTMNLVMSKKKGIFAGFGFVLRMLIYGVVFYLCVKISKIAGLASIIGFLTTKVAIVFIHGIKPKVKWNYDPKDKESRVESDKDSNIFIKDPYLIRYCKGRTVKTHKKYYKRKGAPDA